jgi:uncharacterized damage-inducible protein DinB
MSRRKVNVKANMLKTHFQRMIDWMAWADRRTVTAVAGCPAAQVESLPLLSHLLAAEHVWFSRLERRTPRLPVWPTLTLTECETLAAENATGYVEYLERLGEDGLSEVIEYQNQKGDRFATAVVDILTQVLTHGPYHRGQIAKIIGRAGSPAPETDFIFYVRSLTNPAP